MAKAPAADKAKAPAADKAKAPAADAVLPESVTLAQPYGYIHDDDSRRFWEQGTEVTDADQIADLMSRKAPLIGVTHEE